MGSFSILAAAAERPSGTALIGVEGAFTYAQLADRTRGVMAALQRELPDLPTARSRVPAACVGVVASSDLDTVTLLYALMELSVPFALIHPRLPPLEREALRGRLPISRLFEPGWRQALSPSATAAPAKFAAVPKPVSEAPLCIAFTAGTSGASKACVLSRAALEHAVAASAANFGWQESDRWQLCLSLAHMGGLSILLRCLAARRTVVLTPAKSTQGGIDLEQLVSDLVEHRVTLISLVPTLLQRLLERSNFSPPSSLRAMLIGGDGASAQTLAHAKNRRFPVFTSYGLTEMGSQVATQRFALGALNDAGNGPPLAGVQIAIDASGRILVRGSTLFSGYWQPPELHLPLSADGWFCTQDRGRLDEAGCLHVLGRDSDLIVTGGENVYPAEVERALLDNPRIHQCCVFGVPDATWGSLVCALLVGPVAIDAELRRFLTQRLMPHQRPRRIAVVPHIPQTLLGKIDRTAAAENYGKNYQAQLLSLDNN